jgi:modification methylase
MRELRQKRIGTKTSSFGTPGRINHDSSEFYDSKLYADKMFPEKVVFIERQIPAEKLNKIYFKSSETMDDIPEHSVHLMITSPPYNVKKEYDKDLSLDEYRALLKQVFKETYKKLVTGGRACINVANLGRKPYIPLHSYIIEDMLSLGYLMRGEIIWNKASSASPSTAWGSWQSAANPVLRDVHEYILIFSKESFSRKRGNKINTIGKEEFLEWTKSVWTFPAVSARSIGHPAPFPEELPHRLIQLYTFKDDVVLDPFCGSGTVCLVALKDKRHYIGYDIEPEYVKLANQRIRAYSSQSTLFDFERPSQPVNPIGEFVQQDKQKTPFNQQDLSSKNRGGSR